MKIVFMGTPDFARIALEALHEAGHEIVTAVTQPDREVGRGRQVRMSVVKEYALSRGIPVFQPEKIRDAEAVAHLKELGADVFVVAAFGQILPAQVLEIAPYGCINIHASLLPRLRGAAPIQQAILDGEEETGITIMRMDEGCDTGDILYQARIPIAESDTGGSLFDKLAKLGAKCIVDTLPEIAKGSIVPVKQEEALATYTAKLTKESGKIDWKRDAASIARTVRAMTPWPSAYTTLAGRRLSVWEAHPAKAERTDASPGTVLSAGADGIIVQTGDGALAITSLQAEGKKRMDARAFLNGSRVTGGMTLGG